jgi:hypothetical protein
MGLTRTSANLCDTSASPPEADMRRPPRDVAVVPIAPVVAMQQLSGSFGYFANGGPPRFVDYPGCIPFALMTRAASGEIRNLMKAAAA